MTASTPTAAGGKLTHPNAIATFIAGHMVISIQFVVQHYWHRSLGGYWEQELAADAGFVVLWVGKHGIKAGLLRLKSTAAGLWTGYGGSSA